VLLHHSLLARSEGDRWALPSLDLETERTGPSQSSVTILVVDDIEESRWITARILRDEGYAVIEAESAEHAMRLLAERGEIQVIVADIVMPGGMDGLELARWSLATAPWRKVVLMSGFPRGFSQQVESGPKIPLLLKPFTPDQLASQIREVLHEKMN
jgi:two-component system, chemotaxis family, CheB/CheR fusion protein